MKCQLCGNIIPFEKSRRKRPNIARFCSIVCSSKTFVGYRHTKEVRGKIIENRKINHTDVWTDERRKIQSERMRDIVDKNPQSYSSKSVSGRVKRTEVIDSYGNKTKCIGNWEVLVSKYLTDNSIKWINHIEEKFYYEWNGSTHRYFPDFYLPDLDIYIEVKGFQRERDVLKWNSVKERLIVIKQKEINDIKDGKYEMF